MVTWSPLCPFHRNVGTGGGELACTGDILFEFIPYQEYEWGCHYLFIIPVQLVSDFILSPTSLYSWEVNWGSERRRRALLHSVWFRLDKWRRWTWRNRICESLYANKNMGKRCGDWYTKTCVGRGRMRASGDKINYSKSTLPTGSKAASSTTGS